MSLKHPFFCLVLSSLLLLSCHRKIELPKTIEAYFVRYQIDYLEDRAGDIPTRILPGHMDAYYTKYYVLSKIEGFFNQFALVQIADLRQRKVTTLLTFFGTKVYNTGRPGELPAAIMEPDHLEWEFTGETKFIGGLNSEKVNVDTGDEQFCIYFTKDFTVRRPNITTPYHTIDYPLSKFPVQLSVLKMLLTCEEFKLETVESDIFTIPEDYLRVSRESMERIINSLFTKE